MSTKQFKIEVVKWQWADAVSSKNVYRDDEFVRTTTKEESIEAIDFLLKKPIGLTYTITVRRNNEYFTYYRHSMPCLGGLVKYRDSHGSKHYMNPYFPRDIRVAFPEGDILYIGMHKPNSKSILESEYGQFILSEESPWRAAFGTKETIIFKNDALILTNMNTDPTVFYHLLRYGGLLYHGRPYGGGNIKLNPKVEILLNKTGSNQSYSGNGAGDPRRLAGQKPIKTSGGTWAEGYGYTRPYNESIYKTKLPHKLKQFGKLGGYPNAPHTNEYFTSTMKKIFGVDVNQKDTKLNEALFKAWDYFKEQSKELGEE